jgi:hypothetical protein
MDPRKGDGYSVRSRSPYDDGLDITDFKGDKEALGREKEQSIALRGAGKVSDVRKNNVLL